MIVTCVLVCVGDMCVTVLHIRRGNRDNLAKFFIQTYVVTSHQNCLAKTVLMRGHYICFPCEIGKVLIELSSKSTLSGALV